MCSADDFEHLFEDADSDINSDGTITIGDKDYAYIAGVKEEELNVICVLCGWDIKPSECMISERGPIHKEHELTVAEPQPNPVSLDEAMNSFYNEWIVKHPDWWKP